MTLTCSALQWASWNWTSKGVSDPGMKLAEAFAAFAAAVNATPGNTGVPLSVLKDHNSATGATTYGYVWRLGHPVNPVVLSFTNSSKVQTYNASASSALFKLGLESAYTNDASNGGYGSYTATLANVAAGMSYYAPDGSPAFVQPGMLLVMADTTPGREFFSYTIAPLGGDTFSQNHTLVLFRSVVAGCWCVMLNRSYALAGMFYSQNNYLWNNDTVAGATLIPAQPNGVEQQLIRGCGLYVYSPNGGLFAAGTIGQRIPLPDCLWLGSNQITDPRRLGRVSNPGGAGTFYQLASAYSFACDIWYLNPPGTQPLAGWDTIGSMPWQTMPDRLSFCPLAPMEPVAMGPLTGPDYLTDWSTAVVGAPGVRQHPFYAKQLQGGGGGGGSGRPSAGVLWPRGTS